MCDFAQCRIWFDYECDVWLIDAMAGQNTGKTVAIIVGGAAGVAFLVICLMFARSLKKKARGLKKAKSSERKRWMWMTV